MTFFEAAGNRIMQLSATNSGTGSTSSQAQIITTDKKFLYGTYAARVFFRNAPSLGGVDGDEVVETFFTLTENGPACSEENYGEQDFEYLPNGGFEAPGSESRLFFTSWDHCADSESDWVAGDYGGWHTLLVQVRPEGVRYFVDGALLAAHGADYAPEVAQNIDFNLWFYKRLAVAGSRTYRQDVDWVYFGEEEYLTQGEVEARVNALRAEGVTFWDSVP